MYIGINTLVTQAVKIRVTASPSALRLDPSRNSICYVAFITVCGECVGSHIFHVKTPLVVHTSLTLLYYGVFFTALTETLGSSTIGAVFVLLVQRRNMKWFIKGPLLLSPTFSHHEYWTFQNPEWPNHPECVGSLPMLVTHSNSDPSFFEKL